MTQASAVWIVASEATAGSWAEAVAASGRDVEPLAWGVPHPVAGVADLEQAVARVQPALLLLTSPESMAFLRGASPPRVSAACVGPRTAEAAHAAGLAVALVGTAGAGDLAARLLALRPRPERLLWLRAREAREEGVERLRAAHMEVEELVTYDLAPAHDFALRLARAPEPGAVVVGSPRAAVALMGALREAGRGLSPGAVVVAAGASTAARLAELGLSPVRTADPPGIASILALLP